MTTLLTDALPVIGLLSPACNPPTFLRFQLLAVGAILTTGRRTVSNILRTLGHLAVGAPSGYHRVLSEGCWCGLAMARILAGLVIDRYWRQGTITLVGDDTVTEHPGRKVYGKARHRDAVRSSHSYITYLWGHKWVVLAVIVRFPFASRPWALPVLAALYRSREDNERLGRPHKTPAQIMQLLLRLLLRWFPDRSFRFAGDAGYGSHEMAAFARRTDGRLTLISKFHPDANLYEAAPPPVPGKKGSGRPRQKGAKLAKPSDVVKASTGTRHEVAWYGGGRREVRIVSGVGHWYKGGDGLVEVCWVYARDLTGTHRDEYFYTTDLTLTMREVIELYTQRWNIETTFAEMHSCLGLGTTRGRCAKTVLRAEPCLFGLYTVVALMYDELPAETQAQSGVEWEGKATVTFSDALMIVRRWLWGTYVFGTGVHNDLFSKLPEPMRQTLSYALAQAA